MIPGSGRSPGEGNDNPFQYSCLEIPCTEEPDGFQGGKLSPWGHKELDMTEWLNTFAHSLLQRIFPTQGLNPGLLHCKQIIYRLSHQGSPLS